MANPSNWWAVNLYYTNNFPGYCCNSAITSGNGTFNQGRTYRITRGTWGACTPWTSTTKTIKMCTGCKSNEEAIFEIKDDPTYTVDPYIIEKVMSENNTTSTQSIKNMENEFVVYPNPSNNLFNIDLTNINDAINIEVFDNLGELVIFKPQALSNQTINLSNAPKGIYLIKVNRAGKSLMKKIILE